MGRHILASTLSGPGASRVRAGNKQANFESVRKATSNSLLRKLRPAVPFAGGGSERHGAQALCKRILMKGLILAQNERWRRGLGMQVERIPAPQGAGGSGERGSKAWVTYLGDRDSPPNGGVIPGDVAEGHLSAMR